MTNKEIKAKLEATLEEVWKAQRQASLKSDWYRRDELAEIAYGICVAIDNIKGC